MARKRVAGAPEELRAKAARCTARALAWLKRGAEFEKAARREEKKRDTWERLTWPEEFCKACVALKPEGKRCQLHPVATEDLKENA